MRVFTENQKFTQPLIYISLTISFVALIYSFYKDWEEISNGINDESIGPILGLLSLLIVLLLILSIKLKTRIDEKGIYYQFFPFHFNLKLISWKEIEKCYIGKYNGPTEYGGWGFRVSYFRKNRKAFTTKGNQGLQLKLTNGKKILIGTQKKSELQRVLNTYKSNLLKQ